jgi:hypothetical protein
MGNDQLPKHISKRDKDEDWLLAKANEEWTIARSRYYTKYLRKEGGHIVEIFPGSEDLIDLICWSTIYDCCQSISDWVDIATQYCAMPLEEGGDINKRNPAVTARAIHLRNAIPRLLAIVGAPSSMVEDTRALLKPLCWEGARVRAEVQQAIIRSPREGLRKAAKAASAGRKNDKKASPGQISRDRRAGAIVTPPDGVWSGPD